MAELETSQSLVTVILDPEFGDRLYKVWPGSPVWIAMSPANAPVVRSIWAAHPEPDHRAGITGFNFDANATAEDTLLDHLETIELHHGWTSSGSAYRQLNVFGAKLSPDVRESLVGLGFKQFIEKPSGFSAERSIRSAVRLAH